MPLPRLILLILDLLFITGFLAFAIVSMIEGQRRAAQLSTALTALSGLALTAFLVAPPLVAQIAALTLVILLGLFAIWLAWPVKRQIAPSPMPNQRVDERTIMFARVMLEPGTLNSKPIIMTTRSISRRIMSFAPIPACCGPVRPFLIPFWEPLPTQAFSSPTHSSIRWMDLLPRSRSKGLQKS